MSVGVGRIFESVCLSVRSITQKQMIPMTWFWIERSKVNIRVRVNSNMAWVRNFKLCKCLLVSHSFPFLQGRQRGRATPAKLIFALVWTQWNFMSIGLNSWVCYYEALVTTWYVWVFNTKVISTDCFCTIIICGNHKTTKNVKVNKQVNK